MFIPEFVKEDTCVLVHNHLLTSPEAVLLSAKFTRARLLNAHRNLPDSISKVKVIFDCRGQTIDATAEKLLEAGALGVESHKVVQIQP